MYLQTARSLLHGNGWTIEGIRVSLFPPLYPSLLAVPAFIGVDLLQGARLLQALLAGGSVLWIWLITYRLSGKSPAAATLAAVMALGAVDLIAYQILALSDGAFLFLALAAIFLLALYLEMGRIGYLLPAGLLFGLAALTRYVGVVWILGACAVVLLFSPNPMRARLRDIVLMLPLAVIPNVLWILRNTKASTVFGRALDAHSFLGGPEFKSMLHTISAWLFQWSAADSWWMVVPALALFAVFLYWLIRPRRAMMIGRIRQAWPLTFAVLYLLFLIFTAAFFQADLFRDSARLLMPVHALLLVTTLALARAWVMQQRRSVRWWIAVGGTGLCAFILVTGLAYIRLVSQDGQGYAGRRYRESPLIALVRRIDPAVTVYCNLDLPVSFYAERMVMDIPTKISNATQRPNPEYESRMKSMADDIRDSSAVLAYFREGDKWLVYPTIEEIERFIPLRAVEQLPDGELYESIAADSTEGRR